MAKKPTLNKVILKSIIVVRDGKRVSPPIGKAFTLTEEEIEELDANSKRAYRDAVNEDEQAEESEVEGLNNSAGHKAPEGGAKRGNRGAGKTTAMAGGADGAPVTEPIVDDL